MPVIERQVIERQVLCDGPDCTVDLERTPNSTGYRMLLTQQDIPIRGGFEPMICRIVNRDHYFCSLECLQGWAEHR